MDIFVYSDESGVFDRDHNKWFVYGGLIFLSKEEKDNHGRKYLHAEKCVREKRKISEGREVKASSVNNHDKAKLFRSLNQCYKFGVVIEQSRVLDNIWKDKKAKQRFLDYAYKIALKRALQKLIFESEINSSEVTNLFVFADEHTTATNGRYELKEGLEQEFKSGTYNYTYSIYFPPIFPNIKNVDVQFCDSASKPLIRAADIVANRIYWDAIRAEESGNQKQYPKMHLIFLP